MNDFQQGFEKEMQKIEGSIHKKSGVKQLDKVHERIGRLNGKYPSIARYFDIEIQASEYVQEKSNGKGKGKKKDQNEVENQDGKIVETQKKQIVTSIKWAVKTDVDMNARSGVYFLRTTLDAASEELLWQCYNIIR